MLRRKRFAKRLSLGLSGFAMAGAALTLFGWGAGQRRFTDWFDNGISQLPNNAVGVLAAGTATLLLALGHRRSSAVFALLAGLIGGATLFEHMAGVNLGIDTLLLTQDWGHRATVEPGRMGVPGSTSLVLVGLAIFLSFPERTRGWSSAGALLVAAIAVISITGYVLGATLFYSIPHITTIALQTAILLLALAFALIAALPDRNPTRLMVEDSAAALLVMRSLPGLVVVPMTVGWLTLHGERIGLFDTAFATATMILALIILLSMLLWRTAAAVHHHEAALRRSEERLSGMLGSITDAFMTLDADWHYVFVNQHSEAHWGKSRETLLASTIWEQFPEAVGSEAHRQLQRAMTERVTVEYEYFHAPMQRWYGSRAYPTQAGGLAVYSRDITRRKETENQLMRLATDLGEVDRRKNAFLATLAHELRNPLAPILSGLELLKRSGDDPAVVRRSRTLMERQVRQLVRLIDDLLDMGRINADKIDLRLDRVELGEILKQALEACAPVLERARHVARLSLPDQPVFLHADALRLVQVFVNLVSNACKFSDDGGRIEISAIVDGGTVRVAVTDNGIGIPAAKLEEIFEMFAQVDQSLERVQQGLGIGLTLVRRMVLLHGGSVTASSPGPGLGSTFLVTLPLADAAAVESAEAAPPAPAAAHPCRVLVVDDNRDAATVVAMLLSYAGHAVQVAHEGDTALAQVAAFCPDVVLLDIGMPGMNGYDLCRRLRSLPGGAALRIVALTGWGMDEDRRRSLEAGFDAHLVKPVDEATLLAVLAPDAAPERDAGIDTDADPALAVAPGGALP